MHASPYPSSAYHESNARALPRYSTLSLVTLPLYPTPGELDVSTIADRESSEQAFEVCLERKSSSMREAWATLRLLSTVPSSFQRARYTAGDNVKGSVILELRKPQGIVSISVTLRGQMVTASVSEASHLFIEVVHPIWDQASGVPPPTPSEGSAPHNGKAEAHKLHGYYEWPFSFPFPTEFQDSIKMTSKQNKRISQLPGGHGASVPTYTTPQTVSQRNINFNVTYEVILKITTAGIFGTKHRVTAPVLYVPIIRPPPLPPLRASAYLSGTYIIGPEDDPSGWYGLPTMYFRVQASNSSPSTSATNIECTAYIANPTIYTRGTVIPCYLVCRTPPSPTTSGNGKEEEGTDDISVLVHAFTAQQCLSLTLHQRVHYTQDPHQALASKMSESVKVGHGSSSERSMHTEEGGSAVWWTPAASLAAEGRGDGRREWESCLEGEIHLDMGSLPSCDTPFLKVTHSISATLKPSSELSIQPTTASSDPSKPLPPPIPSNKKHHRRGSSSLSVKTPELPSTPVRIVTAHPHEGPKPAPFTPRPARKKKDLTTVQEVQWTPNVI